MSIVPAAIGLYFCDTTRFDSKSKTYSLVGLFQGIYLDSVPSQPVEMVVFASLVGGRGEGTLDLEFIEINSQGEEERIYRQNRWAEFSDPRAVYNLEFQIKKSRFRKPGLHLVRLMFDGHLVTERTVTVLSGATDT